MSENNQGNNELLYTKGIDLENISLDQLNNLLSQFEEKENAKFLENSVLESQKQMLEFMELDNESSQLSIAELELKDRYNETIKKKEFLEELIILKKKLQQESTKKVKEKKEVGILEKYGEKDIHKYTKEDAKKVLIYLENSIEKYDIDNDQKTCPNQLKLINEKRYAKEFQQKLINIISGEKNIDETKNQKEEDFNKSKIEIIYGNKDIKEYTPNDAIKVLDYLSNSYDNYSNYGINIRRSTLNAIDEKEEANMFQEDLIKIIFGSNEGFNHEYLQGFDKQKGNYVIKMSEFEDQIKNKPIENSNRLVLANYLIYAIDNYSTDKLINIFTGKNLKFIHDRIINPSDNKLLLLQLKRKIGTDKTNLLVNKFEELLANDIYTGDKIDTKGFDSIKYFVQNTQNLDILVNNPEYIQYIDDIDKLNKIIDKYYLLNKNKPVDQNSLIKSDGKLDLKNIGQNIIDNNPQIVLNEKITISTDSFEKIPDTIFLESLESLIILYPWLANKILSKAFLLGLDIEDIKKIGQNKKAQAHIPAFYNEYIYAKEHFNEISQENFLKSFNEFINGNENSSLDYQKSIITKYLLMHPENKSYELIQLAKKGFYGTDNVFKNILSAKNTNYASFLIEKDIDVIYNFDKSLLSEPKILNIIMNKGKENHFIYLLTNAKFENINIFLYGIDIYLNRNNITDTKSKEKALFNLMQINSIKNNIINLFSSNNEKNLTNTKFKEIYLMLQNNISNKLNTLFTEAGQNLSSTLSEIKEQKEKDIEIKKLLNTILKIPGIGEKIGNNKEQLNKIILGFANSEFSDENEQAIAFNNNSKELLNLLEKDHELTKQVLIVISEYKIQKIKDDFDKNQLNAIGSLGITLKKDSALKDELTSKALIDNRINSNTSVFLAENNIYTEKELTPELFLKFKDKLSKNFVLCSDEKLKKYLLNYIKERQKKNKRSDKHQKIKDNIDSYVTYISNPDTKLSFEEHLELEKQITKGKIDRNKFENPNNNYYITNQDSYIGSGNGYSIKGKNGKPIEGLVITEEEKNITIGNPEATENLIKFYEKTEEIGLSKLWDKRDDIFKAISAVRGSDFSVDSNYIGENEAKIFINCILKSVGKQEIPMIFNLNSFCEKFKGQNSIQFSGEVKEANIFGESTIEEIFINKYMPSERGGAINFKSNEFINSIR